MDRRAFLKAGAGLFGASAYLWLDRFQVSEDLQSLHDTLKASGGGAIRPGPRTHHIVHEPVIWSDTDITGMGAVSFEGDSPSTNVIEGSDNLAGRPIIDWTPSYNGEGYSARSFYQRFANVRFILPEQRDACAIEHRYLEGVPLKEQRLHPELERVTVESNDGYHDSAFRLWGSIHKARFIRVTNDVRPGTIEADRRDVILFRFSEDWDSQTDDTWGASYSIFDRCYDTERLSGRAGLLHGRLYDTDLSGCHINGGETGPGLLVRHGSYVRLHSIFCEGQRNTAGTVVLDGCWNVSIGEIKLGIGTVAGAGHSLALYNTHCTLAHKIAGWPGMNAQSLFGGRRLYIDALSSNNDFMCVQCHGVYARDEVEVHGIENRVLVEPMSNDPANPRPADGFFING